MQKRVGCLLMLAGWGLGAVGQGSPAEPKSAVEWFRRADELTNIRLPGSTPFLMSVKFQALPGLDLSKEGSKGAVAIGDGLYQETWLSPSRWRREISFGSYHAIEVRGDGVRKFEASSDYEPNRVLMLLDALFNPVPRNLISPELMNPRADWKIEPETMLSGKSWVRIRGPDSGPYGFLPDGILVFASDDGMITSWANETVFSGKVVSQQLAVHAGDRLLLTADVAVQAASDSLTIAQIEGAQAAPGMTLNPFHPYQVKAPLPLSPSFAQLGDGYRGTVRVVLDRTGAIREAEIITGGPDMTEAKEYLDSFRSSKFRPASIDGSPCEIVMGFNGR